MVRIDSQKGRGSKIARRAFMWVMYSMEPLSPNLLVEAVCHDPDPDPDTATTVRAPDFDFEFVRSSCHNLIVIDASGICRFAHLSVQEYFEKGLYDPSPEDPLR